MERLVTLLNDLAWSLPTWFVFAACVVVYRRLRATSALVMLVGSSVSAAVSLVFVALGRPWTGGIESLAFMEILNAATAYGRMLLGAGILMLALQGAARLELRAARVPTNLLLVLFSVGSALGVGAAGSMRSLEVARQGYPSVLGIVVWAISLPPLLYSAIVLWSRAWGAIQDGHARTTPGRAIGLAFVPVFNLYWVFQMTWGFAKDFNAFLRRHGIQQAPLPEGLFLALPIVLVLSLIPVVGQVIVVAGSVLYVFVIERVGSAVNALEAGGVTPPGA